MKKRGVLAILASLLLLIPAGYYGYFAFWRHEHFYRGLPTSHWGHAIKRWTPWSSVPPSSIPYFDTFLSYLGFRGYPTVLEGSDAALPVLLDLIWVVDAKVRIPYPFGERTLCGLVGCSPKGGHCHAKIKG